MRQLAMALLLALVAFFVLYPIGSLLVTSFQTNTIGQPTIWGLGDWRQLFTVPRVGAAVWNTLSLSATRQGLALLIGVFVAWLIARTDLPFRRWLEVGFWIALFMPTLPVTLSWVLLLGGRSAILNKWAMELPFVHGPLFNIYSWWGIVWVHLMTATMAIKVFLLVPAFRAMDGALEEAARTCGASPLATFRRVVVPIMGPAILVVFLLGLVRAMQGFEVELILGAPARIDVYSTIIYRTMTQDPPLQGLASVLSIAFLLTLVPFVIIQQWYGARGHATITGRFISRSQRLGGWRWPLFGLIAALLVLMTLVPMACLLMGTFMQLFGMFNVPDPWTLDHWREALGQGDVLTSLGNTLRLAFFAAIAGMVVFTAIAYVVARSHFAGRRWLDLLSWLPALIPGLVLSLGLLQMFAGSAVLRPLYGTITVLVLAVLVATMTTGTQIVKNGMRLLGRELEEAGWANGGGRFYTFRRVVLPLLAPTLAVIGLEIFATAASAVGIVALLGTGANQPLSIYQLILLGSGQFEAAAIVGVAITVLTVTAALLARFVAGKAGLREEAR